MARAFDIKRNLERLGYTFEAAPGGGSHYRIKGPGLERPEIFPLHNGLRQEVPQRWIRKLARAMGVDESELTK